MKIEFEIPDVDTFSKALNNAVAAYGDIVSSIWLGCRPQIRTSKFSVLKSIPEEELKARYDSLMNVYTQLREWEGQYEKTGSKND